MIDWQALWLTLQLGCWTTVIVFLLGLPLAYWLGRWAVVVTNCLRLASHESDSLAAYRSGILFACRSGTSQSCRTMVRMDFRSNPAVYFSRSSYGPGHRQSPVCLASVRGWVRSRGATTG
jgi:hypothetical protein